MNSNKIIYIYIYCVVIALLCCQCVFGETKGGLEEKEYEALTKLFGSDLSEKFDKYKDSKDIYDFCGKENVVKCNNTNVIELKLQAQTPFSKIYSDSFEMFKNLNKLDLNLYDVGLNFLSDIDINTLTLDLCKGFKFPQDASRKFKISKLTIKIDDSYWEDEDYELAIVGGPMSNLDYFKLSYVGKVTEETSITLKDIPHKNDKSQWDVTLTDIPDIGDEANLEYFALQLLKDPNPKSYGYIKDYESIKNLGIVSANSKSPVSVNSTALFEAIFSLMNDGDENENELEVLVLDVSLSKPTIRIDSSKAQFSKLNKLTIKNAGEFSFDKDQFPFSGFPESLKTLTFNNWNGGSINLANIKNSDKLESINMVSSSIRDKLSQLNIPDSVKSIDLSNNYLTGNVSDSFCSKSLLKLTNNRLFGKIPECYACYPKFQYFSKNDFINIDSVKCDYTKTIDSLEVVSKEDGKDVNIDITGTNIGFTVEEFSRAGNNVQWSVVEPNKHFIGKALNQNINGYTYVMFNGNSQLVPFKWSGILNVDNITISHTKDATLITLNGDHFSSALKSTLQKKECKVSKSTYFEVSIQCPLTTGKANILVERTDKDGANYTQEIDLARTKIVFCKEVCGEGKTCNLDDGKCSANSGGNNNNNGGNKDNDKSSEESEENQMKVDRTANWVLGIIITVFIIGLIYIAYAKFLAPNSTSTQNSSYRNLRARDEEEFEDGIPMKTREDNE